MVMNHKDSVIKFCDVFYLNHAAYHFDVSIGITVSLMRLSSNASVTSVSNKIN